MGSSVDQLCTAELEATLAADPRVSIRPEPRAKQATVAEAVASLRAMGGVALSLGEPLGEGGMGIVRAAEQRALGRQVAVKSIKPDETSVARVMSLLQEGWISGLLEHPNIVPVHDLRAGPSGPEIVLRRVAGIPWSSLLAEPSSIRTRFGRDVLEWNLRTLMQVCHAVEFAHSVCVLHRDLKPENVMIGSFGEVYLLDWGIAVSLGEDPTGRLPLASEAKGLTGTPLYMAPEMLHRGGHGLGVWTDVYLLGAILYELLTGAPPHLRENPRAILYAVSMSEPVRPEDDRANDALWKVCMRALAKEPADRFACVKDFRLAIQGFLDRRAAVSLSDQAERRLQLLERAVDGEIEGPVPERAELYKLFAECRFGFRQALRDWPDHVRAREGLEKALHRMIDYELTQQQPRAAQALLAELDEPPPELEERVAAACRNHEAEQARLAQLAELGAKHERDQDQRVGVVARVVIAGTLGATWTVAPLAYDYLARDRFPETHGGLVAFTLMVLTTLLMPAFFAREMILATRLNRSFFSALVVALVGQIALNLGAWALGLPPLTIRVLDFAVWFTAAAYGAAVTELKFLPTAIGYLVGFAVAALRPDWCYQVTAATNGVLTLNLLIVWRRYWLGRPADAPPASTDSV